MSRPDRAGPSDQKSTPPESRERTLELARTLALRRLSASACSRAQLTAHLARRGVPQDVVDELLTRFEEVGLVDDTALATQLAQGQHAAKGLTGPALQAALQRRGIDAATARGAAHEVATEDRVRAEELVRRRLPGTAGLDADKRLRRLASMLVRKGYRPSLAFEVVRSALAEVGDDIDDHSAAAVLD